MTEQHTTPREAPSSALHEAGGGGGVHSGADVRDDDPRQGEPRDGDQCDEAGDDEAGDNEPVVGIHSTRAERQLFDLSRKYSLLLVSLIVLGFLYPALDFGAFGRALWTIGSWVVLLGAVQACRRHRTEMAVARGLFIALIVLTGIGLVLGRAPTLYRVILGLHVVFFAWTVRVIVIDVLMSDRVRVDTIYGAIALYLMIGVTGAFVFELVHEFDPSAFVDFAGPLDPRDRSIGSFLYLSFVTLTTLGYGDITPSSSIARLLTSGEAVVGQLYLTILVARLVALHLAGARDRQ